LDSHVVLLHKNAHILDREDVDAVQLVLQAFVREGIQLALPSSIVVDEILVAAGRAPNVKGLNLDAIGVEYDLHKGIKVNDYLQTTQPNIFAAGDVCMDWKFTHAADAAARIMIKNALFSPFGLGRSKLSRLVMPWVTYTTPEIAHVGLYEEEAKRK
jgi:pyruvate/2-oxoglutarate dehydrogenase complex dihydrolipoamide dehydrogenase (E3) component